MKSPFFSSLGPPALRPSPGVPPAAAQRVRRAWPGPLTRRRKPRRDASQANRAYWNTVADRYQAVTRIATDDFHFGPLLPGNGELRLLPTDLSGARCLEVGCGAAQNSVFLAGHGARCTALDISDEQLARGGALARSSGVSIRFRQGDMDELPCRELGHFDLIHSTYALPFAQRPHKVIRDIARLLKPGGQVLLTTGHPLFAAEWLELGDEGFGIFLHDYFSLADDTRKAPDGAVVYSSAYPIGLVCEWLHDAGLQLTRLLEPAPVPIPDMTESEIRRRVPYDSEGWRRLYPKIAHIPVVVIYQAVRP